MKIGQYQMAIENFNKVIRLKQDNADAYNNRGTITLNLVSIKWPLKTSIMPFA